MGKKEIICKCLFQDLNEMKARAAKAEPRELKSVLRIRGKEENSFLYY